MKKWIRVILSEWQKTLEEINLIRKTLYQIPRQFYHLESKAIPLLLQTWRNYQDIFLEDLEWNHKFPHKSQKRGVLWVDGSFCVCGWFWFWWWKMLFYLQILSAVQGFSKTNIEIGREHAQKNCRLFTLSIDIVRIPFIARLLLLGQGEPHLRLQSPFNKSKNLPMSKSNGQWDLEWLVVSYEDCIVMIGSRSTMDDSGKSRCKRESKKWRKDKSIYITRILKISVSNMIRKASKSTRGQHYFRHQLPQWKIYQMTIYPVLTKLKTQYVYIKEKWTS